MLYLCVCFACLVFADEFNLQIPDHNMVINVSADVLALTSTKPPSLSISMAHCKDAVNSIANTLELLQSCTELLIWLSPLLYHLLGLDDIIQRGQNTLRNLLT